MKVGYAAVYQANQQWNINSNGTITGVRSAPCLELHGGGNSPNGTQIDIWTCNGATNQRWSRSQRSAPHRPLA